MKTWHASLLVSGVAVVAAAVGYWIGFRQAWEMGLMAEAAPRGVVALANIRSIDAARTDQVKFTLEGEIDVGLLWWHEISNSRLLPVLNQLSGSDVYPSSEKYVRRLAEYRKANPSPYWDLELNAQVDANLAKADPELAKALAESDRAGREAIEAVIAEYAP
jgi:hypothetical protein